MKIGTEFEFNLPDKPTGTCKGRSFSCPCALYGSEEHTCWTECLKEKECSSTPDPSRCTNFKAGKCSEELCIKCKDYKFECIGLLCSNNVPACLTCKKFTLNCVGCEYRFDPNKNPDAIRQSCIDKFCPSGSYGVISRSGVHEITTDGSLLGKKGMEIITTGRRVDYWEFFEMARDIINTANEKGAYVNERCSIHMHGLASYYSKVVGGGGRDGKVSELERPMPEIIMANLHQLYRRYQNALTWMTSGLDDPKHLTRWEKFRVSILGISAMPYSMRDVRDKIVSHSGGNKYGWANYKFCDFDENGDVKRLHIEVRVADMLLSPSAIAAFACLYYALFIKAVELSRYGLMEVGDDAWMEQAIEMKESLMNNCSDWQEANKHGRFSDTSKLHNHIDVLVAESFELISQVKHILASIGPAYDVLEKLAENPCSIRRCDGTEWADIEKTLAVQLTDEGKFEYEINKIIDTRALIGLPDKQTWLQNIAKNLKINEELELTKDSDEEIIDKVEMHIEDRQSNGEMIWAERIGSMIMV